MVARTMRLAIIVPFLNEAALLPEFLESLALQSRTPDALILVDDGSTDSSSNCAVAFAEQCSYARVMRRPPRPPQRDRLATAAELRAFHWARDALVGEFDVIAKMDADLSLARDHVATIMDALAADPGLGIAGSYLSYRLPDGSLRREAHPASHVRGPTKFYRRECLDDIEPLPEILGWDTFDEARARMTGWRTTTVSLAAEDSVHLRPTGLHDGRLRAFRRWGRCAWGAGSHPAYVAVGAAYRSKDRPFGLGGLNYALGYAAAAIRASPRVDAATREWVQSEEKERLRLLARRPKRQ